VLLPGTTKREEKQLIRRIGAAILMCAVMVLVAAVPLALAETHTVVKGEKGPHNSTVTWVYKPTDYGVWTGHIVNDGLRWLNVDVYDQTTGADVQVMHERIRFAAYNANPTGEVDTDGVVMAPDRTYMISATPNGPKGSSCSIDDVFRVPLPPVADFTATVDWLAVSVDASASYDPDGTIVSYEWDFGDGAVATGMTASHIYSAAGTYLITLNVTDDEGLIGSASQSVMVRPAIPPMASFTVSVNGLHVDVDASGSSDADGTIVSYAWDFFDGATATGVTASHTYAGNGSYIITLVVTDNDGLMATASQSVAVAPAVLPPVAIFTVSNPVNTLVVNVDGSASYDPDGIVVSYDWDFGDGAVATGMTASHTYATPGTWTITLTVTDNNAMTGSATYEVTVNHQTEPPPAPYTVWGYVTDSGGSPVFGAIVTITDLSTGAVWTAITDDEYGYYWLDNLNTNETGWAVGDTIEVTASYGGMMGTNSGIAGVPPNEASLQIDVVILP
jgi:PKD repeat protein